jgi:hypothetical protein
VETVPTELERNGDYSQSLNGSGGLRTIYDPWSTVTDANGNVTRAAFTGNIIPTARLDPIAVKFTSLLWKPTSAGLGPYHTNNLPSTCRLAIHTVTIRIALITT